MQTATLFLIILAITLAAVIAYYQYAHNSKRRRSLVTSLAFLRFLSLLALFMLLINPQYSTESYTDIPPNLIVLADNSSSLGQGNSGEQLNETLAQLMAADELSEQFQIRDYTFGSSLKPLDNLNFSEKTTNLFNALSSLNEIYGLSNTAIITITDGNQTLGQDYEYFATKDMPVYAVAVGDTTRYEDLRIEQVNLNRYAFLGNRYPVEIYMTYEGPSMTSSLLRVSVNGVQVEQQRLQFSPQERSKTITTFLKAGSVGVNEIMLRLSPLENERNTTNNQRTLAIEVVDEQTTVALVSDIVHPDLGTLEKAIESNAQRQVRFVNPKSSSITLEDVDVFLLYQPNTTFEKIYDYINQSGSNYWTITGTQTNWNFLNGKQGSFEKESLGQDEEILGVLNSGFTLFDISDLRFSDYPPLDGELGDIIITKPYESLLGQRIRGVDLQDPLLAIITGEQQKEAILFGENIWKWRMQNFRNEGSFDGFDAFIGKIILYLSNSNRNQRFTLDYKSIFQNSAEAGIRASFFDETFVFDSNASLVLEITGDNETPFREIPMLLKGNFYEADLSNLQPGDYSFTARVAGAGFNESGTFTILDFDVEKQLMATNYKKLERLTQKTGGTLFFPTETQQLIQNLLEDDRFLPIRKSEQIVVSLIDFRWLLAIIVAALAIEWIIRKYNGLT